MSQCLRDQYVEKLARMAAELAGRDPDEHVTLKLADVNAFDNVMWRYPDFLTRAEAAYDALAWPHLAHSSVLDGHSHSSMAEEEQKKGSC
jgi:hypothetical protein